MALLGNDAVSEVAISEIDQVAWYASFPDSASRPSFHASNQLAVTEISPLPIPKDDVDWFPRFVDRVARPAILVASQMAFALDPQPEQPIQVGCAVYPDRIDRPKFAAALQLAVTGLSPFPLPDTTLVASIYPDETYRVRISEQHAFVLVIPEEKIQLDWAPRYPDSADRSKLRIALVPFLAFDPAPERTSALVVEVHPDLIYRPTVAASEQPFFSFVSLEEKVQLDWSPRYPDFADRTKLRTALQPFFSFDPEPEQTSQLVTVVLVDRLDRAGLLVALQPSFALVVPEEQVQLDWDPRYPDLVDRAKFKINLAQFFTLDPQQEQTSQLVSVVFPDRLDRIIALVANQQTFALDEESGERLDWNTYFPDRLPREPIRLGDFAFVPAERAETVEWIGFHDYAPRRQRSPVTDSQLPPFQPPIPPPPPVPVPPAPFAGGGGGGPGYVTPKCDYNDPNQFIKAFKWPLAKYTGPRRHKKEKSAQEIENLVSLARKLAELTRSDNQNECISAAKKLSKLVRENPEILNPVIEEEAEKIRSDERLTRLEQRMDAMESKVPNVPAVSTSSSSLAVVSRVRVARMRPYFEPVSPIWSQRINKTIFIALRIFLGNRIAKWLATRAKK